MHASVEHKPKKIITHSGNFHADDVFACAVLSILHEGNVEIVRSRDEEVWATGDYLVDVGGVYDASQGRFDHHQEGGAGMRENGIPYSSLGLVWKEFGAKLTGSFYAEKQIDRELIQPIDAGDNGMETFTVKGEVGPCLLQDMVNVFRPGWNEVRTQDQGFFEALTVAKQILERAIILAQGKEEGRLRALACYDRAEDKRIILLDGNYPWFEVFAMKPEPIYVVKPDRENSGRYKVETVRDDIHTFRNRKDLPSSWAGKRDQELAEISGVPDAIFCHTKLFTAVAGSREGALALAQKALEA